MKITEGSLFPLSPSQKTAELLAMNMKAETDPIPAEYRAKDIVEAKKIQVIRHRENTDHHGIHVA